MNEITSFRGEHLFLSNFYYYKMRWSGLTWSTAEHAYQASKTTDPIRRDVIRMARGPREAKRAGRLVPLREDWEQVKDNIMLSILREKFSHTSELTPLLLATGDALLVEGNNWGDRYWGVCEGVGQNRLGELLMQVRREIRDGVS